MEKLLAHFEKLLQCALRWVKPTEWFQCSWRKQRGGGCVESTWIIYESPLFPELCLESGTAHAQYIIAVALKYVCILTVLLCLH